ncbi:MAG: iron-containing alcohol dehydrogenase [Cyanobacteriota bacterium]
MTGNFQHFIPTKLHFGAGKINDTGKIAKKYGKKAIIVTGKGSSKKIGALDKVINSLKAEGLNYIVYDNIEPNPRSTTIDEGGELAKKEKCDVVIGLGGGSPMDSSKVIALIAKDGRNAWDYIGTTNPPKKALPVICITTTSGTGSEANTYAVITNPETNEKPGIGFECMFPVESIIDTDLTEPMPPRPTASVGIDVFFHAIEAYTSRIANPISDLYCEKAIELVAKYLHRAYKNGKDKEARENMAIANTLGGMAIQLAGTGLIHAMAHPLSGHYDCAHGEALASISIAIVRHNFNSEKDKYINMANLMGSNIAKDDPNALEKVLTTLKDFYEPLELNRDITELGASVQDLDRLTEDTFKTMQFCVDINAASVNKADVKRIYEESVKTMVK